MGVKVIGYMVLDKPKGQEVVVPCCSMCGAKNVHLYKGVIKSGVVCDNCYRL